MADSNPIEITVNLGQLAAGGDGDGAGFFRFLQQLQANAGSDSASDNDESGSTTEEQSQDNADTIQATIQSVVETFTGEQTTLDDKVSSIVSLQKLILKKTLKMHQAVGKQIVEASLLDIWAVMVMKITNADGERAVSTESSEQNSIWKIMEIIYQLLVKISDVSPEFNKQVASSDLMKCAVAVLKSQDHKEQCVKEVCTTFLITFYINGAVSRSVQNMGNTAMSQLALQLQEFKIIYCEMVPVKRV